MANAQDKKVFISYSRADQEFANALATGLQKHGYSVLIDHTGIHHGADWRLRLGQMILEADTILFVLSPDSVASDVCAWEVAEAHRRSKRVLPVLWRAVDFSDAPSGVSAINAVPFTGAAAVTGLQALVEALEADIDWLLDHTRLEERAALWDAADRPADSLLRGGPLQEAQAWRERRPANAPDLTELQRAYLQASEEEEGRLLSAELQRLKEIEAAKVEAEQERDKARTAQERETRAARTVVRRTLAGLAVATVLAIGAALAGFGFYRNTLELEKKNAEMALAFAQLKGLNLTLTTDKGIVIGSDVWFRVATEKKLALVRLRYRPTLVTSRLATGVIVDGGSIHPRFKSRKLIITTADFLFSRIGAKIRPKLKRLQIKFAGGDGAQIIAVDRIELIDIKANIALISVKQQLPKTAVALDIRKDVGAIDRTAFVIGLQVRALRGRAETFELGFGRLAKADVAATGKRRLHDRVSTYVENTNGGGLIFDAATGKLVCQSQGYYLPSPLKYELCLPFSEIVGLIDSHFAEGEKRPPS
ncbi:MAG: toll/interleukin-1 receptor domain-containing protein [Neomegalonema sp.]|nr:toll/interleukin-1 receptor domain-containing protein [Neomegalonema sp.]